MIQWLFQKMFVLWSSRTEIYKKYLFYIFFKNRQIFLSGMTTTLQPSAELEYKLLEENIFRFVFFFHTDGNTCC